MTLELALFGAVDVFFFFFFFFACKQSFIFLFFKCQHHKQTWLLMGFSQCWIGKIKAISGCFLTSKR